MLQHHFGVYTVRGNVLANRLFDPICEEVATGNLTRNQALEKVYEAIHLLRAVDDGMDDSEPMWAIVDLLKKPFERGGLRAFEDAFDLSEGYRKWAKERPEPDTSKIFEDDIIYAVAGIVSGADEINGGLDLLSEVLECEVRLVDDGDVTSYASDVVVDVTPLSNGTPDIRVLIQGHDAEDLVHHLNNHRGSDPVLDEFLDKISKKDKAYPFTAVRYMVTGILDIRDYFYQLGQAADAVSFKLGTVCGCSRLQVMNGETRLSPENLLSDFDPTLRASHQPTAPRL